jgi:hypothetical protein
MSSTDLVFKISNTSSKEIGTLKVVAFTVQHSTRHNDTLTRKSADVRPFTVLLSNRRFKAESCSDSLGLLCTLYYGLLSYGFNCSDNPASNEL